MNNIEESPILLKKEILQNKALADSELIEKYKHSGNNYHIGVLFKRYTHLISAVSISYLKDPVEAEDAVMEVFEILLKDLKRHEIKNFKAWLYSITKHYCLKRKKEQRMFESLDNIKIVASKINGEINIIDTDINEKVILEEKLTELANALSKLSYGQKKCINLFYIQDKSYKDVAIETGFSEKQVKSYLQNGKRNLYNLLKDKK